jgi:hypothetical protein
MPLSNFKMSSIGKVLNLTYEERRTVREHITLVKKFFIILEKYVVFNLFHSYYILYVHLLILQQFPSAFCLRTFA